jgi:hypothetical protein
MGDVIGLDGSPIPIDDDELVENLARFSDGTLTQAQVKSRHHLSEQEWTALGSNDKLVERVEERKLQRIRSGATKRERAQNEIIDAPPILAGIMRGPNNARHVIDAVKVLDGLANMGAEAAAAGARFEITIVLDSDHVEHYNKSVAINANDTAPDDISSAPPDVIAAITTTKKDDDDGQNYL